jgi:histone acetyltransferase (RNA polymerase elongator complex component)
LLSAALPCQSDGQLLPLQHLLAVGEVSGIRVSTRPDAIDLRTVTFLKGMGVAIVELGVQSMADDVLQLSGRGHGSNEVRKAVSCLRDAGLAVGLQLMPGLPGDTPGKALESLHVLLELKPDFLRIYPTLVIAGTELEKLYEDGSYQPMTLVDAVNLCKVMLHEAAVSGVPVIRMGCSRLQCRTPNHCHQAVSPAFRQLVEVELCYDLL